MKTMNAWYIRPQSDGPIKGPFPKGQISQEMLLGRYDLDDEVSHDKEQWLKIRDVAELVPNVLNSDPDDPEYKDRLAAARRWADERRGIDNIQNDDDRRENESYESREIKRLHRMAMKTKKKSSPLETFIQFAVAFVVIATVVVLAFQFSPKAESEVDCTKPADQGINWRGCDLSGTNLLNANLASANLMNANLQTSNLQSADLSNANLKYTQFHLSNLKNVNFTKASLIGANFLGANLTGANFNQADLSYANFRDANIITTDFSEARLDHAIWIDGRTCKVNSIGTCN